MRKILSICLSIITLSLFSQNFVSTTAENKNVILEEFTGISCGFCPDGHAIAQTLNNANPNDVFLINIHTGSYANPQGPGTDFNTSFGAAISNLSGTCGYPAGTVNRIDFSSQGLNQTSSSGCVATTAMSRGNWTSATNQTLSESSYINVAAQATIDVTTRVLTVIVETYYTGTVPQGVTNNINVALLQNNIPGPQSGAANYNPSGIIAGPWNPTYNHQHMLRHLLTGQWGEAIPVSSGLWTDTYTYTIPSNLNGVSFDLFNLEVLVFAAEGQENIITGNKASLSYNVPAGTNLIDMSASTSMAMPSSYCDNNITPEITVSNNSNMPIDTFEVSYVLNSNNAVTQSVYNSIPAGGNSTISFPAITVPSGTNNISYSVNTMNGSSYVDSISNNNLVSSGEFNLLSNTPFSTTFTESFDNYTPGQAILNNGLIENPNNTNTYVVDNSVNSNINWALGGYGNSPKSYRFRFYQGWNTNDQVTMLWEKVDFSNSSNNEISFSYAHAVQNSWDNSKLQVLVSLDCGDSWNEVSVLVGGNLSTVSGAVSGGHFYPASTDWQTHTVDLSDYDGESDVNIALRATYNGGNNLYIDDVNVSAQQISNTSNLENKFSIHPNPTRNQIIIEDGKFISVKVYDIYGKLVLNQKSNNRKIDINHFKSGVYHLNINTGKEIIIKKIIKIE